MKKLIAFALSAVMALPFAACGSLKGTQGNSVKASASHAGSSLVQLSNPFIECKSLDEAAELSGFDITVPDSIDGYSRGAIRTIDSKMIEVLYSSGEKEIRIRKAVGTEDISGDYNKYAENNTVDSGSLKVTTRGLNSKINVATWTDNSYTFALCLSDGLASDELLSLVEKIQ